MEPERKGRLPVVGVIGSGNEPHTAKAEPLGEWLARQGVHLLTGGGGGVMESVSRAFHDVPDRRGLVIGIIPGTAGEGRCNPKAGYPNRYVEIPIFTHLPLSGRLGTDPMSRNHINILSSDVLVALPGAAGTESEMALAVRYGTPVILFSDRRDDGMEAPPDVPVTEDFGKVKEFVLAVIENK